MASPREIRVAALQALYQLDVRGEVDAEDIDLSIDDERLTDSDRRKAMDLALGAFRDRAAADRSVKVYAPTWPAHRQPAIDRAILRLAHYEMTSGKVSPKVAVNEAVELTKRFSTEKSPAFVNAVLDKILKRVLAAQTGTPNESVPAPGSVPAPDEGES
ncbi:MAG: transcription antitermination factor NusB [Phycisphaerales bacterium]